MNITTESEKNASAPEAPQPKTKRRPAKKSQAREKRLVGPRNRPPNPKRTEPTRRLKSSR
jgi:hypothetical protein